MTHNLRPGLTRAVLDAHDARRHIVTRTVYDDGGPVPTLGQVFHAPAGSTNLDDFRPLGLLAPGGIISRPYDPYQSLGDPDDAEEYPYREWPPEPQDSGRRRVIDRYMHGSSSISMTLADAAPNILNLLFGVPAGWLVFKGTYSGLWWSVPDDDHCDGDLFDTYREAVYYAIEKARTP